MDQYKLLQTKEAEQLSVLIKINNEKIKELSTIITNDPEIIKMKKLELVKGKSF